MVKVPISQDETNSEVVAWLLDSGCTAHIVNTDKYFYYKTKLDFPINVKVGDGHILKSNFIGNIRMFTFINGRKNLIDLKNVYLTPEMESNLISFDCVTKAGYFIIAQGNCAKIISPSGDLIGLALKRNKLYELTTHMSNDIICSVNADKCCRVR